MRKHVGTMLVIALLILLLAPLMAPAQTTFEWRITGRTIQDRAGVVLDWEVTAECWYSAAPAAIEKFSVTVPRPVLVEISAEPTRALKIAKLREYMRSAARDCAKAVRARLTTQTVDTDFNGEQFSETEQ